MGVRTHPEDRSGAREASVSTTQDPEPIQAEPAAGTSCPVRRQPMRKTHETSFVLGKSFGYSNGHAGGTLTAVVVAAAAVAVVLHFPAAVPSTPNKLKGDVKSR